MKKEWADKWITALESGEYPQGRGLLHSARGGYCCLGVLCEVVGAQKVAYGEGGTALGTVYAYGDPQEFNKSVLPTSVMSTADMHSCMGANTTGSLASMNDNGATFKDIVEVIRTHWEEL